VIQKYFIAIVPPEPLLSEIQEIKKTISQNYNTKGALRSPGHITLHMPFNWEEEKEVKLLSCLEAFKFDEAFNITLDGFGCFEPRVVFINVKEENSLFLLQKKLVQHVKNNLQLFNQSDDMRGFHPHITIAFRDLKKPMFYKIWEEFNRKSFQENFNCQSICLLKHINNQWHVYKEFKFST
jgi:2'-5' RNA ligase